MPCNAYSRSYAPGSHARLLNAQRGASRAQTALGAGDTHTVNSIDQLHTKQTYVLNEWLVHAEIRFS